jgi:hypothetical protein
MQNALKVRPEPKAALEGSIARDRLLSRRQGLIVKTDWFSPSSHGAAVQAMLAVAGPGIPKSAAPSLFLRLHNSAGGLVLQ